MAEIVDLDALVGGDLVFKYDGKELSIPGDISTKTVFEIFQAFKELSDAQLIDPDKPDLGGDPDKIAHANDTINKQLLALFKFRQPDMTELPFGVRTMPVVIQEVLKLLGVNVNPGETDERPPVRPGRKTKASSRKKKAVSRSRPSPGSRSS